MEGELNNLTRKGAVAAVVISALLLDGCGSDAIEGKYTVTKKLLVT